MGDSPLRYESNVAARVKRFLRSLEEKKLKQISIRLRRPYIVEQKSTPAVDYGLQNLQDLVEVIHFLKGDSSHPLFNKPGVLVNTIECLEGQPVLTSPGRSISKGSDASSSGHERSKSRSRSISPIRKRKRSSSQHRGQAEEKGSCSRNFPSPSTNRNVHKDQNRPRRKESPSYSREKAYPKCREDEASRTHDKKTEKRSPGQYRHRSRSCDKSPRRYEYRSKDYRRSRSRESRRSRSRSPRERYSTRHRTPPGSYPRRSHSPRPHYKTEDRKKYSDDKYRKVEKRHSQDRDYEYKNHKQHHEREGSRRSQDRERSYKEQSEKEGNKRSETVHRGTSRQDGPSRRSRSPHRHPEGGYTGPGRSESRRSSSPHHHERRSRRSPDYHRRRSRTPDHYRSRSDRRRSRSRESKRKYSGSDHGHDENYRGLPPIDYEMYPEEYWIPGPRFMPRVPMAPHMAMPRVMLRPVAPYFIPVQPFPPRFRPRPPIQYNNRRIPNVEGANQSTTVNTEHQQTPQEPSTNVVIREIHESTGEESTPPVPKDEEKKT